MCVDGRSHAHTVYSYHSIWHLTTINELLLDDVSSFRQIRLHDLSLATSATIENENAHFFARTYEY